MGLPPSFGIHWLGGRRAVNMGGPGVSATIATSAGHTAEPDRGKAACEASHLQSQCLNSGRSEWPPCWHPGNPDPSQRGLDQRGSCHTAPGSPTPASEMMQNEGPPSSGGPTPRGCAAILKPSLGPLPPSPTFREWQGPSGTGGRAGVGLARGQQWSSLTAPLCRPAPSPRGVIYDPITAEASEGLQDELPAALGEQGGEVTGR